MIITVAVTGGASLTAVGSGAFQDALRTLGFGRETAIQAEQRKQATTVAEMERIISRMDNEIGALTSRIARTESTETATRAQIARLDGGLGALGSDVKELRAARHESGEPWRKPVDHLNSVVTGARGDIITLRSSLDAYEQSRRGDVTALTRRLDRLEQAIAREMTSSIRNQAQRTPESGREPGVLGLFGLRGSSAADPKAGHMIDMGPSGH